MSVSDLEKKVDEVAAYSVGNTMLITAVVAALIDAGVLSEGQVTRALKAFSDLAKGEMDAMSITPFEQCATLLQAGGGSLGHVGVVQFSTLTDYLASLGQKPPSPDEGE